MYSVHLRDQFYDSAKNREKRMTITSGGGETTVIISTNDLFDDANGRK